MGFDEIIPRRSWVWDPGESTTTTGTATLTPSPYATSDDEYARLDRGIIARVHCVNLGESFQTHTYLENLASIQPRSSPVKFAASRERNPHRPAGTPRGPADARALRGERRGAHEPLAERDGGESFLPAGNYSAANEVRAEDKEYKYH